MSTSNHTLPPADGLSSPTPVRLRYQLLSFFLTKTVMNTPYRMVYPFLPAIARGLNVPLEAITGGITLRAGLGLLSPLFGTVADTVGRKKSMLAGLLLFAGAMLLVFLWPTYPALIAALLLTSFSKIIFDPSMYAYLGDRVPFRQRGLASAIAEFGWSGAFLLGVPLSGWLIAQAGWNAPFPFLGLVALGMALLLWRILPPDVSRTVNGPSLRQGIGVILGNRAALAALAISLAINTSNEVINIVYGAWMENAFALQVVALGAASAIIGIAELLGEGLVAGLVDRLGKRRSVGAGLVVYILACLILPLLGSTVEGALAGLFLFYLAFEFTVVSLIPLMLQLEPQARATLMAGSISAHSLGRMLGSWIGPLLFVGGLGANAGVAVALNLAALVVMFLFVRETNDPTS